MPVKTGRGLQTITLVLPESQVKRLRALVDIQRSESNPVSLSAVARQVVERGLREISHAHFSNPVASDEDAEAVA